MNLRHLKDQEKKISRKRDLPAWPYPKVVAGVVPNLQRKVIRSGGHTHTQFILHPSFASYPPPPAQRPNKSNLEEPSKDLPNEKLKRMPNASLRNPRTHDTISPLAPRRGDFSPHMQSHEERSLLGARPPGSTHEPAPD